MSRPPFEEVPLSVHRPPYTVSSERADRAAEAVIDCITLCPQQWMGALIVADLAVEHLQAGEHARRDVGVLDLGALDPDGPVCAARITAIHEAFGVKKSPAPTTAANFVLRGAAQALDCIREASLHHASQAGVPVPNDLQDRFYHPSTSFDRDDEHIVFVHAPSLHDFLTNHGVILHEVASDLFELAEGLRAGSRQAQRGAVAKGGH